MSTTAATPKPRPSPDYPKWLRKAGLRDKQVFSEEQESVAREEGWSHEVIVSQQAPPLGVGAPPPAKKEDIIPAGMVPTSVMDGMLEAQDEKFQRKWVAKCGELNGLRTELAQAKSDYDFVSGALKEANQKIADLEAKLNQKPAPAPANPPAPVNAPRS